MLKCFLKYGIGMATIERDDIARLALYPGVLVAGLVVVLFSLLRINHWDNATIIFLGAIGIALVLIGIEFRFTDAPRLGAIGAVLIFVAAVLYYVVLRQGVDVLALVATLGIAMIVSEILLVSRDRTGVREARTAATETAPLPVSSEVDVIDRHFTDVKQIIQSYRSQALDEIDRKEALNRQNLMMMIKTRDALERSIDLNPSADELRPLKTLLAEYEELFMDLHIEEIQVNAGDPYNAELQQKVKEIDGTDRHVGQIIRKGYRHQDDKGNWVVIRKSLVDLV